MHAHTDLAALREFAKGCDAVTFDHEHVPSEHIRTLEAEGVKVHPGADALVFAQDKRQMRERLGALGAPVAVPACGAHAATATAAPAARIYAVNFPIMVSKHSSIGFYFGSQAMLAVIARNSISRLVTTTGAIVFFSSSPVGAIDRGITQ